MGGWGGGFFCVFFSSFSLTLRSCVERDSLLFFLFGCRLFSSFSLYDILLVHVMGCEYDDGWVRGSMDETAWWRSDIFGWFLFFVVFFPPYDSFVIWGCFDYWIV